MGKLSLSNKVRSACILCGKSSFKNIFGKKHFLFKCRNCGMVSARTIPTSEELKDHYFDYPSYESIPPLTLKRYNDILNMLEPYRKNNNLLETGCGFGLFLEVAKGRNWNVSGTELSEAALIECRKKKIPVTENIEQLLQQKNMKFDVVVSLEVIEHLTDPVAEVSMYAKLLRPEGALYITTPNFNSFTRRLLGRFWNVISYPEHLHYFTSRTIHQLLENDFTKIKNQTAGISPARMIYAIRSMGSHKVKNVEYDYNEADRHFSDNIEKTILLRLIKKAINYCLAKMKLGDSLKVLYQKKA